MSIDRDNSWKPLPPSWDSGNSEASQLLDEERDHLCLMATYSRRALMCIVVGLPAGALLAPVYILDQIRRVVDIVEEYLFRSHDQLLESETFSGRSFSLLYDVWKIVPKSLDIVQHIVAIPCDVFDWFGVHIFSGKPMLPNSQQYTSDRHMLEDRRGAIAGVIPIQARDSWVWRLCFA